MLKRATNLPKNHSFFLFGPRQTGKTSLVRETFEQTSLREINLLITQNFGTYAANPTILREEVLALPTTITHVFLDEIQRVPDLLNEVHALIEDGVPQKFILTGSSARKLRRGSANLLGGRAWNYSLFPLTHEEMKGRFNLNSILAFGSLPPVALNENIEERNETLRSYVDTYLKEEIEAEALSRNIGGFIRFLKIAGQCNGDQINYSNIARDVQLSSVTIKEYFKILEDTLIGNFLLPFSHSERKRHKFSPKFYFFDTGVLRSIQQRLRAELQPASFEYGNYFETWVINEVVRLSSYKKKDFRLSFLRTAGDAEVDLIIETPDSKITAVEIKSKKAPIESDFVSGFEAIRRISPKAHCVCVCTGHSARKVGGFEVLPYCEFIEFLNSL